MKIRNLVIFLLAALMGGQVLGLIPIHPEDVFKDHEIKRIHDEKNYFLVNEVDKIRPIWTHTHRKYGNHLLGKRTSFIDMKTAIRGILLDGFTVQRRVQDLYRAKMGIQSSIGSVLPGIKLSITRGAGGAIDEAFGGLLGFLSPSNWLSIPSAAVIYNATRYLMVKDTMDQILAAKLMYLNQHQLVSDFEIKNFYFIHLQLLASQYPDHSARIHTLMAEFGVEGTDMATQRGNIKLGFDDLALLIALEKIGGQYDVDKLNIEDIKDFPRLVHDLEDVDELYKDKEKFLHEVIQRSVELGYVREMLKVAKLGIGIAATGNITDTQNSIANHGNTETAIFRLGWSQLPNTLIAVANKRTAQIDVRANYLQMLDNARRSFDTYTNSLGGFTEAKRAIRLSREALESNLKEVLDSGKEPDANFIVTVVQLLHAELQLNNALHGSLQARARLDRYLLIDDTDSLKYLPNKWAVLDCFKSVAGYEKVVSQNEEKLDKILRHTNKPKQLQKIFDRAVDAAETKTPLVTKVSKAAARDPEDTKEAGIITEEEVQIAVKGMAEQPSRGKKSKISSKQYTKAELQDAIYRNMDRLSHRRWYQFGRSKFYQKLYDNMDQEGWVMPIRLRQKVEGKNAMIASSSDNPFLAAP